MNENIEADSRRNGLKIKWMGLNPGCPEFVPRQVCNIPPFSQSPAPWPSGWMPRGLQTTWQYDLFPNPVVGGYYPRTRTRGIYLFDLDPVPVNPNIDVSINLCFNCWCSGHHHHKCKLPRNRTFCDNCGRNRVTVDHCPRCARAYHRSLLEKQARKEFGIPCCNDGHSEKDKLEKNSELDGSSTKKEKFGGKSNCSSVASQVEEGYFSIDGSENFDDVIVDEDLTSDEYSSSFLQDFVALMDLLKPFPIETQNDIVQGFVVEHRKQLEEKDNEKKCLLNRN